MILNISKITIEGFMSIGHAEIDFTDLGTVLVKGRNEYEELAASNGSGKSAIFEAILWVLTGKTSRGSSNVVNRYTSTGTEVVIHFSIDDTEYVVTRTEGGSKRKSLKILRDGEDISGNTLTKSRDILSQELGFINYEVLTSIIILSQGLPGRLSTLTPASRKSRLEFLSNTDGFLEDITNSVNVIYDKLSEELRSLDRSILELETEIRTHKSSIDKYNNLIKQVEETKKSSISRDEYEKVKSEINELQEDLKNVQEKSSNYEEVIRQFKSQKSEVQGRKRYLISQIDTKSREVHKIVSNISNEEESTCPTCLQKLSDPDSRGQVISKLKEQKLKLAEYKSELNNIKHQEMVYDKKIQDLQPRYEKVQKLSRSLLDSISVKEMYCNKYNPTTESVAGYEKLIEESEESVSKLSKQLVDIEKERADKLSEIDIAKFYKNSASRQLRNYLLENVIRYLNSKLEEYSSYLFKNQGVVKIESEGNRVDIKLGDSYFEDLSGGEGRRVDLLLQLAQRDLSTSESGFRCNILVLDEILDYLDTDGVVNTLNLLDTKSSSVGCMMVVTHREEVPVPYDNIITAVKSKDRITHLEYGEI